MDTVPDPGKNDSDPYPDKKELLVPGYLKKKIKLLISHALCVYINYHFSIHNHLNVSMAFAGSGPTFDTDPEHSTFRMDTMWARGRNREFFMIRALASSPHLI